MNRIASAVLVLAAALIVITWSFQDRAQAKDTPNPAPAPEVTGAQDQPTEKAWLGIGIADLNQKIAERLGITQQQGVVITNIVPDSPASKTDLKQKDIITSVNGVAVSIVKAVLDEVGKAKPGDKVTLGILRNGQSLTIDVTAGTRPAAQPRLHALPQIPYLKELEGVPPQELFNHFLGLELNILDKNNQPATVRVVPGTVASTGTNSVSVTPNGSSTAQSFSVTGNTQIYVGLRKSKLEDIKAGDKVVVLVNKDSSDARGIFDLKTGSIAGFGGLFPGLMMPGIGQGFRLPEGFFFPKRQPQPEAPKAPAGTRA